MKFFEVKTRSTKSKARAGVINTAHGKVETPAFLPCGTKATVKTLTPKDLNDLRAQIVLSNAYHLYLRPGMDVIKKMGGLHKFMGWNGPIFTDSGGFQVFSLGNMKLETRNTKQDNLVTISDRGVEFKSHLDGSKHFFTPEKVVEIQLTLGSDIFMPLDECAPASADFDYAKVAMQRTHDWLTRSVLHLGKQRAKSRSYDLKNKTLALGSKLQAGHMYGIIQGVTFEDLRIESAKFVATQEVSGVAIGGLSVGEGKKKMYKMLDVLAPYLPEDKPVHLLGVGDPRDILKGVLNGVDTFDCVAPTRIARNGTAMTKKGNINLNNSKFRNEEKAIDKTCKCYACQNFSTVYVAHLVRENEILGAKLLTIHNLHFMFNFMAEIREAIKANNFEKFAKSFS